MPFLPGRIYGRRPILDIHSQQSDRLPRVDTKMDSLAVVPLVIVSTWSAARHASKVGLQRSALANISTFLRLPLIYILMSPGQVDSLLLDPGQLHISRITPLQKMKCIQIKCKTHQKRKHYNIHSLRTPLFLMCIRSILWPMLPRAHHLSCCGHLFSTSNIFERRKMNEQTNTYFPLKPISF